MEQIFLSTYYVHGVSLCREREFLKILYKKRTSGSRGMAWLQCWLDHISGPGFDFQHHHLTHTHAHVPTHTHAHIQNSTELIKTSTVELMAKS